MGFIGSFLGKVAGEAALQGAEVAKQKLSEKKTEIEVQKKTKINVENLSEDQQLERDEIEAALESCLDFV